MQQKQRAVFFDRDGTVIAAYDARQTLGKIRAPFRFDELVFDAQAQDALTALEALGYARILTTNQPDVAHGYLTQAEWEKIHRAVVETLRFDDVFICLHRSQDACPCKKPKPGMFVAAAEKWSIDLAASYMIGDTKNDMLAGKAAGCTTILLERSYNAGTIADIIVPDLARAIEIIIHRS